MTNRRSIRVICAIRVSFFISHGFHRFLSFFLILYRSLEQHPPNFAPEIKKLTLKTEQNYGNN